MTKIKNIGVCMDHASANIIEFPNGIIRTKTISSDFTHEEEELIRSKSEKKMHNTKEHDQAEYFKEIAGTIQHFDDALIFGPTNAKEELYNILCKDERFNKINIEVKHTDKMTELQQKSFVRDYFARKSNVSAA